MLLPDNGRNMMRALLVAVAVLSLTACSLSPELTEDKHVAASRMLLSDHPLVGKIWDVRAAQFVDKQQVAKRIIESDYLMLGETHDNAKHHQGQAWAIAQLGNNKRSAAVAFEMISQQQGQVISGRQYDSTEALIAGLNHIKTNWNYEGAYRPVFAATLTAGYAVLPANFDRDKIMLFARKGEAELPQKIKTLLDENALSNEQEAASRKEIEGSHCGMINDEMTAAMMLVQRAKDAKMALALEGQDGVETRVLVAGSGHVRNDRGVMFYLPSQGKKVLTMAWAEVEADATDAGDYAAHWGAKVLPFDYVWFTSRVDRPDPCKQFRQHMKNRQVKLD